MPVFRIDKTKDYTVMSNFHLRDRNLSLKAKGLLSLMLSLPPNWDYTMQGLAHICKDGIDSVRAAVLEIEKVGYLQRQRLRNESGQLGDVEYTILEKPDETVETVDNPVDKSPNPVGNSPKSGKPTLEKPILENPMLVNPILEKPMQENPTQSITNESTTKESNTDILNIHQSIRADAPENPVTMDSIEIYSQILKENIAYDSLCQESKYSVDQIDEIFELMLEAVCSTKKSIRIGGEDKPTEVVRSRMLKLDQFHIEYVLDALSKNTTEVRNIKSYILTTLYNAPATIDNYYKAMVNHDLYSDK